MKKLLLSLGVVGLVLIVLLIALVIFLPKLVDTQTFRTQLTEQVRELTGQELSVNGELSISVFPWLGIRTGEIRLSQPPSVGLDQPVLLSVQQANVGVKFLPLFQKKIEISEVLFESPTITYIETKNGSTSLDGINQIGAEGQADDASPASPDATDSSGFQPAAIVIAGVSINNGKLTVDNQAAGERHQVDDLTLSVGNLLGGKQEPLSFSANVIPHQQQAIFVELTAQALADLESQQLALNDVKFTVEQDSATALINLQSASVSAERAEFMKMDLSINTGELMTPVLKPELAISRAVIDLVDKKTENIAFSLIEKNLDANASGDIQLDFASGSPLYKGQFSLSELAPIKIINFFEIDYAAASDKVLQKFSLGTHFNGSDKGVSVSDLSMQLDESTLKGNVAIVNFEQPAYRFLADLDRINIDDYLPPSDPEATPEQASQSSDESMALLLPIAIFKQMNANGIFSAGEIQAAGVKLQSLNLNIASTKNTVNINPSALLYEGKMSGAISYKAVTTQRSTLDIAPKFTNVHFGDLLTDADITDQVSGKGSIDINVQVVDDNGKQSNQGTIAFLVKDGALKNIDIQEIINDTQDKIDRLKGKTPAPRPETRSETRFAEAVGTFTLNNFVLTNNDLLVKAPAFRVNGEGEVDIEQQAMDYLVEVALVKSDEGQGGQELSDLQGVLVPVAIKGDFEDPKISVDVKKLIEANTKKDVDQEVQEKKEKLIEDTKKKLLDKLFN